MHNMVYYCTGSFCLIGYMQIMKLYNMLLQSQKIRCICENLFTSLHMIDTLYTYVISCYSHCCRYKANLYHSKFLNLRKSIKPCRLLYTFIDVTGFAKTCWTCSYTMALKEWFSSLIDSSINKLTICHNITGKSWLVCFSEACF